MKKLLFGLLLLMTLGQASFSQDVNGTILLDSTCLKVVKVWGTHEERGYASGYLLAEDIRTLFENYIKPAFGAGYTAARNLVIQGNDLAIDSLMKVEAQAMIDGITAAGFNTTGLDCYDVLVGNCMLDISELLSSGISMGCSSLMSWGDATNGTDLDGKPVITRHLDWQVNSVLVASQVMVIHLPSESDEQNWMLIGFAGMMSALSGINADLGVFQHVMSDFNGQPQHAKHYKPIWFALRDALEKTDYNNDGTCNVLDLQTSLDHSSEGFAGGYIISALSSDMTNDDLIALVAELTPLAPTHTYRTSAYPDSIPGDNLYTANYQIARNNSMHFCNRYNGIRDHIGNGTLIGTTESWDLMKAWSCQASNYQVMQYAPESGLFRIAARTNSPAYMNEPIVFDVEELFSTGFTGIEPSGEKAACIYPNPGDGLIHIENFYCDEPEIMINIHDLAGKCVFSDRVTSANGHIEIQAQNLETGFYRLVLSAGKECFSMPLIINR